MWGRRRNESGERKNKKRRGVTGQRGVRGECKSLSLSSRPESRWGREGDLRESVAVENMMSMMAPLEPPITFLMMPEIPAHRRSGSACTKEPSSRMAVAGRRKVAPQSPSPTMRSSSVR